MREQPQQRPPPVQRLRIRYAKRGRLRFTSHRDFSRAFERAVFRARIPMAYSSGFNPHPRISYAGAAPTGSASEAEYLEIALAEVVDPETVRADLDAVLPAGLDVLIVVEAGPGALADRLEASRWRIELDPSAGSLDAAVESFWGEESVVVERMTKKGVRSFDCRAACLAMRATGDGVLEVVLRHTEPAVRPDDVVAGLARTAGLDVGDGLLLTRLEQGPYDPAAGTIADPFAR